MCKIVKNEFSIKILQDDYHVIVYTGSEHNLNDQDDNVDIEIVMNDSKRYSGTVFTLKNIKSIMEKDKQTGECCNGLYFGGCKDLILVDRLSVEIISKIIRSIYEEGNLETVFCPL